MKKENEFRTSEYWMAVTFLTLGEELIDIERNNNSKRAVFVFKNSLILNKHIEDFRRGKILIEPTKLFLQHRLLKSRLYSDY